MSFTLTIGGQAYAWKPGTLGITETLGGRSTCEFTIDDADGTLAAPIVGQAVLLLDGSYRIFGGSVETLEIVRYPGVEARVFRVSCVDYHRALDRRLAGKYSWQQKTAGSIVVDICTNSLQGEAINLDFIQAGPVVERFEIDYPTVAEAIQQGAQLAKMFWTVDYDRQLRFFAPDSYAAPFELTPTSKNFTGLTLRSTREQYANRVISRIGQYLRDEQTARFDASGRTGTGEELIPWMKPDGTRKRWAVTYPIHAKPVVRVNGVEKTVGVQGTDVADWLWNTGSSEVQQDPTAAALASGAVLEISYVGLSSEVLALQNTAEVNLRAAIEGNSGYYEVLKDGSTEMTRQDANQFAAAILDSLDELSGVATIQTTGLIEPLASTARVGQRIHVDVGGYRAGGRGITAVAYGSPCVITAPSHGRKNGEKVHLTGVQNLSGTWVVNNVTADSMQLVGSNASGAYSGGGWVYPLTFLIRQIRVSDIPGFAELAYSIECVLGPITADAVSFFRDLAVVQGIPPAAPAPADPGTAAEPTQPGGTDWTIGNPAAGDYRADASGAQHVRLTPTLTAVPVGSDYVEFWLYRGAARPADPGLWEQIGSRVAAGIAESWQRQPEIGEASTWCICCTASSNEFRSIPTAATPLKTVVVSLVGLPPAVTGAGVELQASPVLIGGKQLYRLKYTATAPVADLNYLATRIYARWTDGAWSPLAGEDGTWKLVSGPETFPAYSGNDYDIPAPDAATQYRQFVFLPINHGLQENWTGAPIVNTTWSADGGFSAASIRTSTLGEGVTVAGGKLKTTARTAFLNGDFEYGLKDWIVVGAVDAQTAIAFKGTAARIAANGGLNYIDQVLPVIPGQAVTFEAYVRNSTNADVKLILSWNNAAGGWLGNTESDRCAADSAWRRLWVTGTAPAGAASVHILPGYLDAGYTTGYLYVDNATVAFVEQLSGAGVARTAAGLGIPDAGIAAGKFAIGIEPVGLVTATANSGGELILSKTQSSVYNTTDGKLYRWSVDRYKRPMSGADVKEQLTLDKLTAGQITAGAIGTTELSAVEILVGGGTGKPPRFKMVNALGTMIGFMGDDGAGFVGIWSQSGRFGGTFGSPVIDLSSSSATITGADFSLTKNNVRTEIKNQAISGYGYAGLSVNDVVYSNKTAVIPGFIGVWDFDGDWGASLSAISGYGGSLYLGNTSGLTKVWMYGSDGSIHGGFLDVTSAIQVGSTTVVDSNRKASMAEYQVLGSTNPVIDSSRNFRFHTYYTENLDLGSLTATRWIPAYDASGNYLGKIPVIP
jgi:hypothetical protein